MRPGAGSTSTMRRSGRRQPLDHRQLLGLSLRWMAVAALLLVVMLAGVGLEMAGVSGSSVSNALADQSDELAQCRAALVKAHQANTRDTPGDSRRRAAIDSDLPCKDRQVCMPQQDEDVSSNNHHALHASIEDKVKRKQVQLQGRSVVHTSIQRPAEQRPAEIVIGIMSARHHFEHRQALRDTWVGYAQRSSHLSSRVHIRFVVGDDTCAIPVEQRQDPYGCEWAATSAHPDLQANIVAYTVPSGTTGNHDFNGPIGMDFTTNHPVVLTHLGVFDSGSDGLKRNLTASLYLPHHRQLAARMTFTPDDPGELIAGSRFKPLSTALVLPAGYIWSIVAEGYGAEEPAHNIAGQHGTQNDGGGLLTFMKQSRFGHLPLELPDSEESARAESNQYAAGTFVYHAEDSVRALTSQHTQVSKEDREQLEAASKLAIAAETAKLVQEHREHGDMLILPNFVDTYRRLPQKVLAFYTWVTEEHPRSSFTLKIDDDCFANLDEIFAGISRLELRSQSSIWWSRFRTDWPVDRWGKWKESEYTSPVYPAFACGGGNVLSMDLVRWLAANRQYLHPFQGEDVSVGIWLAPLHPTTVADYNWHVLPGHCNRLMYTMPELTPAKIRQQWSDFQACQNPCGCIRSEALAPQHVLEQAMGGGGLDADNQPILPIVQLIPSEGPRAPLIPNHHRDEHGDHDDL
ncbi:UDP-GalNAc:betaGlcNAc beta 1,3-galactosaminyltransferase [Capsaspora owczarzaki ATCC 30864]|uniref:UDP-GalNAc:beta-1,3-N-acetylgalactosaminyltransferase 2 n=1 Tax=Capsaspora owczarzaki (strain ATCC 30864) TaxID=595528 RepID=A0A0D2WN41_CAPO3|nr:UDP-GalNAc:betaGlcNAc beta 1,3-galactosaminyltransferase [Capsaspora owczarzaki ATCC 30864]KJE92450.1 UDP-GalNAc:betaGlcNAc beta 1,3-galactosaminyltransferase [Capsaspora owczarzaki ATCC 30864]|eukprot:XP_004364264.2 UDP-GalNAc:betaGlcNAc beta 1,3-galactosaminyltransferase [Capsaspora owczarzaki ATCC 30864]